MKNESKKRWRSLVNILIFQCWLNGHCKACDNTIMACLKENPLNQTQQQYIRWELFPDCQNSSPAGGVIYWLNVLKTMFLNISVYQKHISVVISQMT